MKYDISRKWVTIERNKENEKYSNELTWASDCFLRHLKGKVGINKLQVTATTFEFSADLLDVLIKFTCEHDDQTFDKRFFIVYLLLFQMHRDNFLQIVDEDIKFFEELKQTYDLFVQDPHLQFRLPPVVFNPAKLEESSHRIITDLIMTILGPYLERGEKLSSLSDNGASDKALLKPILEKQEKDAQQPYSIEKGEQIKRFRPAIDKWLTLYAGKNLAAASQVTEKNYSQSNNVENANHCGFWSVIARCSHVLCTSICSNPCDDTEAVTSDETKSLISNRIHKSIPQQK